MMVEILDAVKRSVWAVFGGLLRILGQLEFDEILWGSKSAHEILARLTSWQRQLDT